MAGNPTHSADYVVVGAGSAGSVVARRLLDAGHTVALIDADIAHPTIGPPATVGVKHVRTPEDLEPEPLAKADALGFVGSTSPQGHLLPLVTSLARLHVRAREEGADFVVVDTSGLVSGIYGQLVKYHKVELLQPDLVVGLQRGEELDPLLGVIQRFFDTEVVPLGVHPAVSPASDSCNATSLRSWKSFRQASRLSLPLGVRGRTETGHDTRGQHGSQCRKQNVADTHPRTSQNCL